MSIIEVMQNQVSYLWSIEHHGRKTRRHFAVETNLYTGLYLVFSFHQGIQKLIGVNNGFTIISHQTDERRVPFVDNF